jgi:S1-C subfamily serine protease
VTSALASLSDAIAAIAAAAAPWLVAIRVGPHAHTTGIAWADGLVVTAVRGLPARNSYTLVLPGGDTVTATPARREPSSGLASLCTDRPHPVSPLPPAMEPALGSLAVVVSSDFDASPTIRLAVVHRLSRAAGQGAILDLTEAQVSLGALVFDPNRALLGMAHADPSGVVSIVPHRAITRFAENIATPPVSTPPRPTPIQRAGSRRGWFGIGLQPITVPEPLVPRAGQASGRLIVGITSGGPAEEAGLRIGDVLLSLNGHSTSGANSLRAFLESARVGDRVEARILRDTSVVTRWLAVAEHP